MQVLLDGDILLECFLNKSDSIKEFNEILEIAEFIDWKVYVNKRSIKLGDNIAFQVALKFKNCIIHVDSNLIEKAKKSSLQDFESAIELAWATDNHLDAIITLEPKFFEKVTKTSIKILTLQEFLIRIRVKQSLDIAEKTVRVVPNFPETEDTDTPLIGTLTKFYGHYSDSMEMQASAAKVAEYLNGHAGWVYTLC
jgi:hypothetical protein